VSRRSCRVGHRIGQLGALLILSVAIMLTDWLGQQRDVPAREQAGAAIEAAVDGFSRIRAVLGRVGVANVLLAQC
jgi:hypothetical protein